MLEIEILKCEQGIYSFRIVKQTLRGDEFNPRDKSASFTASNGYILRSATFPAVGRNLFYVRGRTTRLDDEVLETNEETFDKVTQAIKEYNAILS